MARQVHASVFCVPLNVEELEEWVFFFDLRRGCVLAQSPLDFPEMGHRERTLEVFSKFR